MLSILILNAALVLDPQTESGALDMIYHPVMCVTDPCPQFKVTGQNGEDIKTPLGADLIGLEFHKIPADRKITVLGTWVRDGNYLKVTVKEWMLNIREKIVPAETIEPAKPTSK